MHEGTTIMVNNKFIAGVDEAGRGPLAGPVVAAAVILDPNAPIEGLNDSKKLSEKKREQLYPIIQTRALAFAIASASVEEIDGLNILQATLLAMQRAIIQLTVIPTLVRIDGNCCPKISQACEAIIKGDQTVPEISAASILAKVFRDRHMIQLHQTYPHHGFAIHKGYPTAQHLLALKQFGITCHHRRSFAPVKRIIANVNRPYDN
jgi:ribonuclease HII